MKNSAGKAHCQDLEHDPSNGGLCPAGRHSLLLRGPDGKSGDGHMEPMGGRPTELSAAYEARCDRIQWRPELCKLGEDAGRPSLIRSGLYEV